MRHSLCSTKSQPEKWRRRNGTASGADAECTEVSDRDHDFRPLTLRCDLRRWSPPQPDEKPRRGAISFHGRYGLVRTDGCLTAGSCAGCGTAERGELRRPAYVLMTRPSGRDGRCDRAHMVLRICPQATNVGLTAGGSVGRSVCLGSESEAVSAALTFHTLVTHHAPPCTQYQHTE